MIGRLSGRLDHRASDHVLIDVKGVGYVVFVSERTLAALPAVGEFTSLYTDLLVREDLLQLFGFETEAEKAWHKLLMSVQGIGAKASMAILGTLGADGTSRAIALGDWNAVKAAPGVGPKIAQRAVNELKDKAPTVMAMGAGPVAEVLAQGGTGLEVIETPSPAPPAAAAPGGQADALPALQNLGYAPGEAAAAVAEAGQAGETDAPALILDFRDTPGGGNTTVARAIIGHFVAEPKVYQIHRNMFEEQVFGVRRQYAEYVFPRGHRFQGKVVALGGYWTGSVGEAVMQAMDKTAGVPTIGTGLGDLLGTLNSSRLGPQDGGNPCLTISYAWDKLFASDGTPREDFLPGTVLSSGDTGPDGSDPALEAALKHLSE